MSKKYSKLIWVLGDQLNRSTNLLSQANKTTDQILLIESRSFAGQHKHHKKKLIFQFSAMRHFADELRAEGFQVKYIKLEDTESKLSFEEIIEKLFQESNFDNLLMMEAADYETWAFQQALSQKHKSKVQIVENDLFLSSKEDISEYFEGKNKKSFLMEHYYRKLRRKYKILLQPDEKPLGGQWNFDKENRKPLKNFSGKLIKHSPSTAPDEITNEVIKVVEQIFPDNYGVSTDFNYCVTRKQALEHLKLFAKEALPYFGDFQDAMSSKHWFLFHGLISYLLNFGLLKPLEVIQLAEIEYENGNAPLNSVEGFIRQILGWREYVFAIYKSQMPHYKSLNYFENTKTLPAFMWTGGTKMNCLNQCVSQTIQHAYAHHIQRLMVIGNFCLLAGLNPQEVCEWYLIVYLDALEWVELPNTLGMSQYADGGIVGTKPYVSSGKYIDRMSDYCKTCHYDVSETLTEMACPFNYLYWNFFITHQDKLKNNPRLGIAYKNLFNKSPDDLKTIKKLSNQFLESDELKPWV